MIDRYVMEQIIIRDITLYDMIGGDYIDPSGGNWASLPHMRIRENRFKTQHSDTRLCELLTEGDFDPDRPYNNLEIPVKDLVRYWWNTLADHQSIIEIALHDLFTYYKDIMVPPVFQEEPVDVSDSIDAIVEAVG